MSLKGKVKNFGTPEPVQKKATEFDITLPWEKLQEFDQRARKEVPPEWSEWFVKFLLTCPRTDRK